MPDIKSKLHLPTDVDEEDEPDSGILHQPGSHSRARSAKTPSEVKKAVMCARVKLELEVACMYQCCQGLHCGSWLRSPKIFFYISFPL